MSATAARTAALETLRALRTGALADHALETAAAALDARERGWTQELVYGTLRLRGRLDHRLTAHSRRALARLDPDILDILRLGAYQLLEMGGVPAYAAVSQSVELAKRSGARSAAAFVNGVLQSLRRDAGGSTFPDFTHDPVAYLTTWGSHPRWLVERWIARYGADAARRLTEQNNTRPDLYLRALAPLEDVRARLALAGVEAAPVDGAPHALRVTAGSAGAALAAAPVIVQDPAAGLVVDAAADAAAFVVDVAAAPGGKALALALDDGAARFVAAMDVSPARLERLRENCARLARAAPEGRGAAAVYALVGDARAAPVRERSAPFVLLDAPCTGTGTLRRHVDGRWRVQPAALEQLAALQTRLLDAAAALVADSGLLVYSTCSLEREENEDQVAAFLERQPHFALEPVPQRAVDARFVRAHMLHVTPHDHGFDGAFAARLRRRAGALL